MKQTYIEKQFRPATMAVIEQANRIIENFAADGYDLTLRQLYYQFVAQDLIPNKPEEYDKLGSIVNDARLAGLIDWDSIVDRTRSHETLTHWNGPGDILQGAARSYHLDLRGDQDEYIEVWVEKDALSGIIQQACEPYDVGYLSCRGYVSQSTMWQAAQRLLKMEEVAQSVIIHLGDHDPSGIDMTRDIQERLGMFGSLVQVERIALNLDQIELYEPPPNPAKITDSRYDQYRDRYGEESWELDALDPHVLTKLIEQAIFQHTNLKRFQKLRRKQESDRMRIQELADNWED